MGFVQVVNHHLPHHHHLLLLVTMKCKKFFRRVGIQVSSKCLICSINHNDIFVKKSCFFFHDVLLQV